MGESPSSLSSDSRFYVGIFDHIWRMVNKFFSYPSKLARLDHAYNEKEEPIEGASV